MVGLDNVHEEHRKYSTDRHTENARVMLMNNPYHPIYCTVVEHLHFIPNKQLDIWTGLFISPEVHM